MRGRTSRRRLQPRGRGRPRRWDADWNITRRVGGPCTYFTTSRGGTPQTTKDTYQPFVQYTGEITSPAWSRNGSGQAVHDTESLTIVIDRCHSTPKVAAAWGTIPAYACAYGGQVALRMDVEFYLGPKSQEPTVSDGKFSLSHGIDRFNFSAFTAIGAVTGNVRIPKHGHGTGSSEIAGTLTPSSKPLSCPVEHAPYTLKFKRTWSYLTSSGLH